jgi:hypothetical protein
MNLYKLFWYMYGGEGGGGGKGGGGGGFQFVWSSLFKEKIKTVTNI